MKVLWVKAGGLVPPDTGGKIRSYNILRELARGHAITFFSFYAAHANDLHPQLKSVFDRVICIPLKLPASRSLAEFFSYAGHFFRRNPYGITKYCTPLVKRALRQHLQEQNYDVIVCDFLAAAGAIPWDHPGPKVLFTHNVEAVIWKRHYELANNSLWKIVCRREWRAMNAAERKYLARADHVLAVSAKDRDFFASFLGTDRVTLVPTGVDTEYFHPSPAEEAPDSLVFTGSMDWLPNEDAILYFLRDLMPKIRARVPRVSLCVVGRKPSRHLQNAAAADPGVAFTGWVEDVRPFMARAAVYIVPLRIGGGTRLKIFEAMAMAKPVVSTVIGAEGLPVSQDNNILLAQNAEGFADGVVSLLRDADRRRRLGQAGRKLVQENYGWPRVAGGFAEVLKKVADQGSPKIAG